MAPFSFNNFDENLTIRRQEPSPLAERQGKHCPSAGSNPKRKIAVRETKRNIEKKYIPFTVRICYNNKSV